jgi:hemerythrin
MKKINYKVWLVRSPELNKNEYWNIINLLKSISGVIKFYTKEKEDLNQETEYQNLLETSQEHSWFFEQCNTFRANADVGDTDMVIYLSDLPNKNNYFLRTDDTNILNAYIQTSGYNDYFPGSDIRHPIAFHIAVTILIMQWFENNEEAEKVINYFKSTGGILDFCSYKKDVSLKLRTADLSQKEIDSLIEKKVDPNLILTVLEILEKLRSFMLLKRRYQFEPNPLILTINKFTNKFYFEELGNIEVKLTDLEKVFYLTFLKHVNGIRESELLENHEKEMFKLYNNSITDNPLDEEDKGYSKRVKSIQRICKSYSEYRNTIKGKFELAIGSTLAELYSIDGPRSHKKKIDLDRKYFRFVDGHGKEQPFEYVKKSF